MVELAGWAPGGRAGRSWLAGAVLALGLALAPQARAQGCSVDLFREHDPARPPRLLVDPPVRQLTASPYLDLDAPPPGTRLTFYRVNEQTSAPDPLVPLIRLRRIGDAPEIDFGPFSPADSDGDTTPDCVDACPADPGKTDPGACGCGVADTDSDGDATPDCLDGCPADPGKVAPGACGCGVADTDSDGDATPDCLDGCPADPDKVAPGACGCGVADTDSDGDATPDCLDGCPADPGKTDPGACGCGVADTDSDGDTTPDCLDGCPADPGKTDPGACGCGVADTDSDGDTTPDCVDGCPADPGKTAPGACGCGVADTDSDGDTTPDCVDGCPNDASATAPRACCDGTVCTMLCPGACAAGGGTWRGSASCSDAPPPCDSPASCATAGPFTSLAKQAGGGTVLTSHGLPVTAPVDLHDVDSSTGVATDRALTLSPDTQRPWNFTGARDAAGSRHAFVGGRPDVPATGTSLVVVDTATATLVSDVPLSPQVNVAHLDYNHVTRILYGLVVETPGMSLGVHFQFNGALSLVTLDPASGTVTTIASGLPGGLDHYAATVDSTGGRYFYHVGTGTLHAVSLATGATTPTSVPPDIADLQFDDATSTLYGLRITGNTSISGSGTDGWRTNGAIDLVRIDPVTGMTTVLNPAPLPPGTTNWASAFDCEKGHYLYVSADGNSHVLDVATGAIISTAPPPASGRHASLD